jgi:type IX secretion system PorP/SprF family membrane protein
MKKAIITLGLAVVAYAGFGQQDAQFTQYNHNKLTYNPGYAGMNGSICAVILYRSQWMSFPGQPKTGLINIDAPVFQNNALHGGAGLTVISDALGNDNSLFARACYSYHLPIGAVGKLGIGIEAGMIQKSLKYNWIPPDGVNTITTDLSIPDAGTSAITYDLNFGLYYNTQKLFVGLSASHLPQQELKKPQQFDFQNARHYFILAGYTFDISSSLQLMPSVKVKSDAKSTIFDVDANLIWNNMIWAGAGYRMTDALAFMAGFMQNKDKYSWKIGISYDLTLSELKNYSSNTPEVMLGYCFKLVKKVKTQSHINPRFLK